MAKGLDCGTSYYIAATEDTMKKQRNVFLTVDGDAAQVKRMLKRQKIPFVEKAGKVHIVGQHAFNYAQIFSTTELKRPMQSGLLNPKEKDALPVLNAIIGELLGKAKKDEVCVYCVPAKPIDQTREVSYHEDVLKQIIEGYGYDVKVIEESIALAYEGLVDNDLTGIAISMGAGMCLRGDTKIPLLNGETKTIKELADNHADEKFWVYSSKEDGQVVPGLAWNPHKVKTTNKMLRLWFDNDEYLDCTPDHLIMMRDGTYKEAQDLEINDSLMPLYLFKHEIDGRPGYYRVKDNKTNRKKHVHRLIAERFYDVELGKDDVIHHINFNPSDNRPENLQITDRVEHMLIHKQLTKWVEDKLKGKTYEECFGVDKAKDIKQKQSKSHDPNHVGHFKKGESTHNKGLTLEERYGEKRAEEIRQKIKDRTKKAMQRNDVKKNLEVGYKKREENRALYNHKLVKIEQLNIEEDVYDMTVDKYHNFAIDSGIFVHNCNVAVMYQGMSSLSFSVARGGDWVDANVAADCGCSIAKVIAVKENSQLLDLTKSAINDIYQEGSDDYNIINAIRSYYGSLINYLLVNLSNQFNNAENVPNFPEAIPIVFGGGTSLVKGFMEVVGEQFNQDDFPIQISDIKLVEDAHTAVARGCLSEAQLITEEKDETDKK